MKTTHAAPSRHYHGTFADFLAPEDIVPLVPLTDEEWYTIRRAAGGQLVWRFARSRPSRSRELMAPTPRCSASQLA